MVGGNAAELYGFDLDALAPIAARVGPTVDEVARPLDVATRSPPTRCAARRSPPRAPRASASDERSTPWDASATAPAPPEQLAQPRGRRPPRSVRGRRRSPPIYETDPERASPRCCRRRSSRTDEPLVRVTIATVDLGRRAAAVRRRHVRGAGHARGHDGNYPLRHADDHRAVGRSADARRSASRRSSARSTLDRDGDRVTGTVTRLGTTFVELTGTRHRRRSNRRPSASAPTSTSSSCPRPTARASTPSRRSSTATATRRPARLERVDGEIILRESRFDPVADLPVRRIVEHRRSPSGAASSAARSSAGVPASGSLPFVHQRYDDLVADRRRHVSDARPSRARSPSSPAAPAASVGRWASAFARRGHEGRARRRRGAGARRRPSTSCRPRAST